MPSLRYPREAARRLAVVASNAQATGFRELLGYARTGETRPWTGDGTVHDAVILEPPAKARRL